MCSEGMALNSKLSRLFTVGNFAALMRRSTSRRSRSMSSNSTRRERNWTWSRPSCAEWRATFSYSRRGGRFERIEQDEWDRTLAVNVRGVWQCCKACVPAMREAGGGLIINIASLAAVYGMPFGVHYATSKAAVIGTTRALGRNWIRVNAIAPSAVLTEGADDFFRPKKDRLLQAVAAGQSLQKNLTTDDLTGTVLYLASDASGLVTGQTLMVDGGTVFL